MQGRFQDKVALVTGGASGIGRASAHAFAAEGASVAIADIDREGGEGALQSIIAEGGQAIFVEADVATDRGAHDAVDQVVSAFGGLDVLHNNAGRTLYGDVTEIEEADWDATQSANLKSVYLCSRYAVRRMRERGGGAIVSTSSAHAFSTQPLMAAYASAKAGVVALTKAMALDHAREGIRVNCVCPGTVDTLMVKKAAERFSMFEPEEAMEEWAEAHPAGRIARPEEVAKAVLYLASEDASFITGTSLSVDGGLLASLM